MIDSPFKIVEKEAEEAEEKIEDIIDGVKKKIKKPWYKRIHFWIFGLFILVIGLAAFTYFSYWVPIKNTVVLAQQTQKNFEKVETLLLNTDFLEAKTEIKKAQKNLEKLKHNVDKLDSPLMLNYLKIQYRGVQSIITAIKEFSDGLYLLTNLAQDTLSNIKQNPQNKTISINQIQRKEILTKFSRKRPELNGAKAQIDLALLALNQNQIDKLNPKLAEYVSELKVKMILLRNFLDKAVYLSESLPSLLGLDSEKTYLFLLQNNNELRPTGGFIGTVGILKVKDGEIIDLQTKNVYDFDRFAINHLKILPPQPLKKYTGVKYWYLRDSNWLPDFIESAKKVEWFYHQEAQLSKGKIKDEKIDGLIAITPKVIEEFLGVVKAISVDSFVFNKDNFVDRLQYLVEVGYQEQNLPFYQRKDIIGNLTKKMIQRTENISLNDWIELSKIFFNNLNQKHILIKVKDPIVQNNILSENWAGNIDQTREDYLMVVDANLAALKSNQCVTREIDYSLAKDLENDKIKAKVEVTYKNNCTFTWKSTRYRTYTRIYVPLGSKWISTSGSMDNDRSSLPGQTDILEESNKTVFGTFIAVEPGETGTLSFEYYLPDYLAKKIIAGKEYNLSVQKQAGTLADQLNLNLVFPHQVLAASPGEKKEKWGDKKYQLNTNLLTDRRFRIGF